jgi:NAD+ synthetase
VNITPVSTDYERIRKNVIAKTNEYLVKYPNLESLVLGISGGIDSALVAALIDRALEDINQIRKSDKVKLIGMSIPITTNKDDEIKRADMVGKAFCDDFTTHSLGYIYRIAEDSIIEPKSSPSTRDKFRMGNAKARLRMIQLYDLAAKFNGMVLSTDNLTEYLLGFWTLHGDVGDFGPIWGLWKTEVYGLSRYLADEYIKKGENKKAEALRACITAVPTDGLGITDSDLDQLGASSYDEVDDILSRYLINSEVTMVEYPTESLPPDIHPVIRRHFASEFKRNNPKNLSRDELFA